jgi:hypothetical protein
MQLLLQGIYQSMKSVSGSSSLDDLTRVSSELVQIRDKVREELQTSTNEDITRILNKLEKQELLTPEERNLVGFWLVGDAQGYIKMEDDFNEWQEEFRRLSGVLESYMGQSPSPQTLVEAHGVLEDAIRVAADISFFLEKKERVERFNAAINNLTPDDAKFIASMIQAMLSREDL